jgi:putative tricarboxylic transport membrane protein
MSFVDSFLAGLSLVGNVESFAALFIGVAIGTVAGAIPGLSATMAVALTLPFTFSMTPITGILLLLGVYKGGIFGGSIPAILIKTPGTPASSATILDGYPLAEKGQAGKALGMALWASCTADLISNLSLILFAGWLASFALSFGPPEFFALILFSLTIIAGVSGESLLRGTLSAMLGLLLATIGLDLIYGTQRFTFENPNMMGGLNFIAVLIGLFAIPEIISMVWNPKHTTVRRARWAIIGSLSKTIKILSDRLCAVALSACFSDLFPVLARRHRHFCRTARLDANQKTKTILAKARSKAWRRRRLATMVLQAQRSYHC